MRRLTQFALCILQFSICIAPASGARLYTPVRPDPVLESWRWTVYPELRGMGLRCMAEDAEGSMWFGTDNGVVRYDGLAWTPYSTGDGLPDAAVTTLCVARDSTVYAGTELGISRFRQGGWEAVFPRNGDLPWAVLSLTETSDGSLWAGTPQGALRLRSNETRLYTTAEMAAALRELAPEVRTTVVPPEAAPGRPGPRGSEPGCSLCGIPRS